MPQVQHDFGEGPCLAAFAEDRVVAVEDLRRELVWDRIAVVVRQLQVRGVLSVPAFAVVTAELVRTAVELANHQVEVAQLRRALAGRVWIEQAKGMVAATEGVSLDAAFQQLRGRARGLGRPSRRGRPPRPGWPGRQATMDRAQDDLAARERAADRRERLADERTGPLMTATMSPTPASGRRMCATGSPTNATAMPTSAIVAAPPSNATAPPTSAIRPPPTPSSLGG